MNELTVSEKSFIDGVVDEYYRAEKLHPQFASAHEGYAVIKEEIDEFWDEVKKKSSDRSEANMRTELLQIAAMAMRCAINLGFEFEFWFARKAESINLPTSGIDAIVFDEKIPTPDLDRIRRDRDSG